MPQGRPHARTVGAEVHGRRQATPHPWKFEPAGTGDPDDLALAVGGSRISVGVVPRSMELFDELRRRTHIGVRAELDVAGGGVETRARGPGDATAGLVDDARAEFGGDGGGVVGRPIVDDDDLVRRGCLARESSETAPQKDGVVETGNDDSDSPLWLHTLPLFAVRPEATAYNPPP